MRRSVISSASSGEALLLSAISAGAQLSQPQQTSIFAPPLPLWRDGQAAALAPVRAQGLTNPTVTAAIDALQRGDRAEWSSEFEPDADRSMTGRRAAWRSSLRTRSVTSDSRRSNE
jgi:hypothetical protein